MNRPTSTIKQQIKLEYRACNNSTLFSTKFFMIVVDNEPIGSPITEEQAKCIINWFNTIAFEYNETTDEWDKF